MNNKHISTVVKIVDSSFKRTPEEHIRITPNGNGPSVNGQQNWSRDFIQKPHLVHRKEMEPGAVGREMQNHDHIKCTQSCLVSSSHLKVIGGPWWWIDCKIFILKEPQKSVLQTAAKSSSVGEPNHVHSLLFLGGPTDKFTSDRVTEGERALHIFVAGTVNGCTDLQNAQFYEAFVGSIWRLG